MSFYFIFVGKRPFSNPPTHFFKKPSLSALIVHGNLTKIEMHFKTFYLIPIQTSYIIADTDCKNKAGKFLPWQLHNFLTAGGVL